MINSLTGPIDIDESEIRVFVEHIEQNFSILYRHLGIVFQYNSLIKELSVAGHLRLWCDLQGSSKDQADMNYTSSLLHLRDFMDNICELLSGGERQSIYRFSVDQKTRNCHSR